MNSEYLIAVITLKFHWLTDDLSIGHVLVYRLEQVSVAGLLFYQTFWCRAFYERPGVITFIVSCNLAAKRAAVTFLFDNLQSTVQQSACRSPLFAESGEGKRVGKMLRLDSRSIHWWILSIVICVVSPIFFPCVFCALLLSLFLSAQKMAASPPPHHKPYKLLIHSANQIVQVVSNGARILRGSDMGKVAVLQQRVNTSGVREGVSVVVDR